MSGGTTLLALAACAGGGKAGAGSVARATFPPYPASASSVVLDVGVASLHPRNTWQAPPSGFSAQSPAGGVPPAASDSDGLVPNDGDLANLAAFPQAPSSQGTIYVRLQRMALTADDSVDMGATFFDSTGNLRGGYGALSATAFTVSDGGANSIQWIMSGQPADGLQVQTGGTWQFLGARYANSHASASNADPDQAEIVVTWQRSTYWAYFDGAVVAHGTWTQAPPAAGLFSQVVVGGYPAADGPNGRSLGAYAIERFQVSSIFTPPPLLAGAPTVAFYGDSFVVQGGGMTGDAAMTSGVATPAQVDAAQAQTDPSLAPGASAGTIGQDGFISLAQAYALHQRGGFLRLYTAAQSGHGWAYTGMGGTTPANTPAIDDFALGKTAYSDALVAAQPAYVFAFGSVNDVNNGVPADIVGDVRAHFDYWANHDPALKGIFYVEPLSWERVPAVCTSRGGPVGWVAEMTRQRTLLRQAFSGGTANVTPAAYSAGTRGVPVTYIPSYETWVLGPNSARFLIGSNPDNHSQSADTGASPNGHPDAEGNLQMVDAYVWPYLKALLP